MKSSDEARNEGEQHGTDEAEQEQQENGWFLSRICITAFFFQILDFT